MRVRISAFARLAWKIVQPSLGRGHASQCHAASPPTAQPRRENNSMVRVLVFKTGNAGSNLGIRFAWKLVQQSLEFRPAVRGEGGAPPAWQTQKRKRVPMPTICPHPRSKRPWPQEHPRSKPSSLSSLRERLALAPMPMPHAPCPWRRAKAPRSRQAHSGHRYRRRGYA
jgi:hypothetical protein